MPNLVLNKYKNMPYVPKRTTLTNPSSELVTSKGDVTKSLILDAALYLAGRDGFEGILLALLPSVCK